MKNQLYLIKSSIYIIFQSLGVEIFMYLEFFLRKIQLQCRFLQSPCAYAPVGRLTRDFKIIYILDLSNLIRHISHIPHLTLFYKFFLLNCPHAASISDPSSLRIVATIPCSFK